MSHEKNSLENIMENLLHAKGLNEEKAVGSNTTDFGSRSKIPSIKYTSESVKEILEHPQYNEEFCKSTAKSISVEVSIYTSSGHFMTDSIPLVYADTEESEEHLNTHRELYVDLARDVVNSTGASPVGILIEENTNTYLH